VEPSVAKRDDDAARSKDGYVITLYQSQEVFEGMPLLPAAHGPGKVIDGGYLERARFKARWARDEVDMQCTIVVYCARIEQETAEAALKKVAERWWKLGGAQTVRLLDKSERDEEVERLTPTDPGRVLSDVVMEWGRRSTHYRYT